MQNTATKGSVTFLIFKKGDTYIGICKEFGFVEEADTEQIVLHKLQNGSELLLETVAKDSSLEKSLNTSPPFKYLVLFYILPIVSGFLNLFRFMGDMRIVTHSINSAHA